jgi:hypothetical protein
VKWPESVKALWRQDVNEGDAVSNYWWFSWGYIHPANGDERLLRWYFRARLPVYSHHAESQWWCRDGVIVRWWQWCIQYAGNIYPMGNSMHGRWFSGWVETKDEPTQIIPATRLEWRP